MRVNIKNIKAKKPEGCSQCLDECSVDKAVNWIKQENLDGSSHNLVLVALGMIAHNSGLVGSVRRTQDGLNISKVTYQLECTEPCKSRIVVHTHHYSTERF